MKSTFSILFYIDRSKTNEQHECVIRCRITCNGSSSSFSTGLYTSPDDWQAKKGRIKVSANRANAINLQLNSMDERLHALYERTLREENYITAEYLKEQYLRYMKPIPTLIELYQSLCESKKELEGHTLSKATVRAFKDSQKSFAHFLRTKENEGCLPKEADKDLIENYRLFMLRDLGNKESSVSNRLRHLHQVIRKALQERYIREDPFELIDIETPTYERNALTSDDLHKLLLYRPHRSVDNHCRLIFLLGCFTGLAFSDLKKLRMDDVYTFGDGRRYISLCRTKTQNRSIVPLLPIAEKILTIVSDGRKEGLLFREFPTNSHFNRKIRDIIIKAGLPPHTEATSHTARHTFATTICLENGLPIETVSKMLGHRFISTTELYAKVSKSKIAREMQPLMGSNTTRELQKALRVCPPRKPSGGQATFPLAAKQPSLNINAK
ncbi:site-specific integrase [Prevotella intermedia]|uniref:Recombinase n=1 Tax=Prevotella intermedia TaxID=28131 RepID=A0A2D3N8Y7_PREIN|nr:site-specific integrase [Prevotella intermedia]ATV51863.1 recombinase [Prevotella intermedia]